MVTISSLTLVLPPDVATDRVACPLAFSILWKTSSKRVSSSPILMSESESNQKCFWSTEADVLSLLWSCSKKKRNMNGLGCPDGWKSLKASLLRWKSFNASLLRALLCCANNAKNDNFYENSNFMIMIVMMERIKIAMLRLD